MDPTKKVAAVLGVLLVAAGVGTFAYWIADYTSASAEADRLCPLYTDFSKPVCQQLLDRLNRDNSLVYAWSGLLSLGPIVLILALAPEARRTLPDPVGAARPRSP